MNRTRAVLLLLLGSTISGAAFDEADFICPATNRLVPSALVCDGTINCPNASKPRYNDEWTICIPAPYMQEVSVAASELTGTSVLFSWSGALKRILGHPLKLAGYFLTGKSKDHVFQDRVHRRQLSHRVEWLKPSTLYTFIFRPYYTDDGVSKLPRQIGRATSMETQTLSADYYLISIDVVNSTAAVITWRVFDPAKHFLLEVHEDLGSGNYYLRRSHEYYGLQPALSTYNVIVGDLKPWTYYMVTLEDCSAKYCNLGGNRTFLTPPDQLPSANVTRIESRRPGSFELEWVYPQDDRPYDGFRVRYCEDRAVACSLVFTKQKKFAVEGLANDTLYNVDVRAQLKVPGGRVVLGPPGTASVVTWTDVPVLAINHEAAISDLHGASVFSWTTPNSSVQYFEYRLHEKGTWTPCNQSHDCNATVAQEEPGIFTSGFITVRHYTAKEKVSVGFRGCNMHGCGKEYRIEFSSGVEEPIWGPVFEVHRRNFSALLRWKNIGARGFEITGRCGEDWKMHYEKNMHQAPSLDSHDEIEVRDLPVIAEKCEFFMRTYETRGNITQYEKGSYDYPEE